MKYLITLIATCFMMACSESKKAVDVAAETYSPSSMKLEAGFNDYVQRTRLPSGIELGLITLQDGERVKYWFISHHLTDDMGCTRFDFLDGSSTYLHGWSCCELELPKDQLSDRQALLSFISNKDGISP